MDKNPRKGAAEALAFLLNAAVAVLALIGAALSRQHSGIGMLRYYTVESNLFGAAACGIYAVFLLRRMLGGAKPPRWARLLKYMALCCLMVTFIVVVLALAPGYGRDGYRIMLLRGDMLYHHLLCPLLALLSFLLFDRVPVKAARAALIALIPTALYAVVTTALNAARVMHGPYPFLYVYEQPVWVSCLWFAAILGGAYGAAALLARLRKDKKD